MPLDNCDGLRLRYLMCVQENRSQTSNCSGLKTIYQTCRELCVTHPSTDQKCQKYLASMVASKN